MSSELWELSQVLEILNREVDARERAATSTTAALNARHLSQAMMKVTVIDSDSWTFVQRGEDVVDHLPRMYITTLFICHFHIIHARVFSRTKCQ